MQVKDIVNREVVNLTNCEQEPIHIPGSIQPHGFLIGVNDRSVISFCSGNVGSYLGLTHLQLLGKNFEEVFGQAMPDLATPEALSDTDKLIPLEFQGRSFLLSVHKSAETTIIEGEPAEAIEKETTDTYQQTRKFVGYMEQTSSLRDLCSSIAEGTREVTGYDRVMIYRFDEEYNGEVFAESKREDLEPFLGLHYPHTDIPVQARALYLKNLLRLLADINYEPVPIYTINEGDHSALDLSLSILRSTSPIHVQYLQNMGVRATLTISLIHNNRLWGLIACHHYSSAKVISPPVRLAAQLLGHFITSQIDVRQSNEVYEITKKTNEALEKATSFSRPDGSPLPFGEIASNPLLLDICNAGGVCIAVKGTLYTGGVVPSADAIRFIIDHISARKGGQPFRSSHLQAEIPEASAFCDTAAGVIYYPLSITSSDGIIWFRGETIREVNWGGDPNKAIIKDVNGLHPRKSFELWKEVVKCKSKPWLEPEINAAATYAHALEKQVAFLKVSEGEARYRNLTRELEATNEELENINWISTHDLQEPLRKIQLMGSRLVGFEQEMPDQARELVQRMRDSAARMQTLLKDILNFTKVRHAAGAFERTDLRQIVEDIRAELSEAFQEKGADLDAGILPQVEGNAFLIRQLFMNLITNSLKFASPGRPQLITIGQIEPKAEGTGLNVPGLYHHIVYQDRGIGFEDKFAGSIFKLFSRLHTQHEYQGSGVGLALCKKIMEAHGGMITASGLPGEGAVFHLYFPVSGPPEKDRSN